VHAVFACAAPRAWLTPLIASPLSRAQTTSIVVFTFFLFLRELWRQLLIALLDIQDEEDDDAAAEADDEEARTFEVNGQHEASDSEGGSVQHVWDDGDGGDGGDADALGEPMLAAAEGVDDANGDSPAAMPSESTPPPPSWVNRLATPQAPDAA
jgi:hypothetical protein